MHIATCAMYAVDSLYINIADGRDYTVKYLVVGNNRENPLFGEVYTVIY